MALCQLRMTPQRNSLHRAASVAALVLAASCWHPGDYVWVAEYRDSKPPPAPGTYILGAGDVISVRVYNQEAMSASGKIRSDGKISLPFLNDIQAEGYTPTVLGQQLEARFKDYVNKPVVTVSVVEQRTMPIAVVGDVGAKGTLNLPPDSGVLTALATAGGLTELAHRDRIFVIRWVDQKPVRIRFKWQELQRAEGAAGAFRLRAGDQIVVE